MEPVPRNSALRRPRGPRLPPTTGESSRNLSGRKQKPKTTSLLDLRQINGGLRSVIEVWRYVSPLPLVKTCKLQDYTVSITFSLLLSWETGRLLYYSRLEKQVDFHGVIWESMGTALKLIVCVDERCVGETFTYACEECGIQCMYSVQCTYFSAISPSNWWAVSCVPVKRPPSSLFCSTSSRFFLDLTWISGAITIPNETNRQHKEGKKKKRRRKKQALKNSIVSPRCLRKFQFQQEVKVRLTFHTIRNTMAARGMKRSERRLRSTASGRNLSDSFPVWTAQTQRHGSLLRALQSSVIGGIPALRLINYANSKSIHPQAIHTFL